MSKKSYDVCENVGPTRDGSFKSCLCTLLIVFSICMILLLIIILVPLFKNREESPFARDVEKLEQTDSKFERLQYTTQKPKLSTEGPRKHSSKQTNRIETNVIFSKTTTTTEKPTTVNISKYVTDHAKTIKSISSTTSTTTVPTIETGKYTMKDPFITTRKINIPTTENTANKLYTSFDVSKHITTENSVETNSISTNLYTSSNKEVTSSTSDIANKTIELLNTTTNKPTTEKNTVFVPDINHYTIKDADNTSTTTEQAVFTTNTTEDFTVDSTTTDITADTTVSVLDTTEMSLKNNDTFKNKSNNFTTEQNKISTTDNEKVIVTSTVASTDSVSAANTVKYNKEDPIKFNETVENLSTVSTTTAKQTTEIVMGISKTPTTAPLVNTVDPNKRNKTFEDLSTISTTKQTIYLQEDLDKTTTSILGISVTSTTEKSTAPPVKTIKDVLTMTTKDEEQTNASIISTTEKTTEPSVKAVKYNVTYLIQTNETTEDKTTTTLSSINNTLEDSSKTIKTTEPTPIVFVKKNIIINEEYKTTIIKTNETNDDKTTTISSSINNTLEDSSKTIKTTEPTPIVFVKKNITINEEYKTTYLIKTNETTENKTTTASPSINNTLEDSSKTINTTESTPIVFVKKTFIINENNKATSGLATVGTTAIPTTTEKAKVTEKLFESTIRASDLPDTALPVQKLQDAGVCESASCKKIATNIMGKINYEADACEDFYEFSCGNDKTDYTFQDKWERINNKLMHINNDSLDYLKTFKRYYDSCVSFHTEFDYEDRVEKAKFILKSISRLYDRTEKIPVELTLTDLLIKLFQHDTSPLFDISLVEDESTKRFVFELSLGKGMSLLSSEEKSKKRSEKMCLRMLKRNFTVDTVIKMNDLYAQYLKCMNDHSNYLNTLEKAVNVFGGFAHLESYNISWHIKKLRTSIEWDVLGNLEFLPTPPLRDLTKRSKFKISELNKIFPLIKWNNLVSKLTGKLISDDQFVFVYFKNYFVQLFSALEKLDKWLIHDIFIAMFAHDLYTNFVIPELTEDPETLCVQQTSNLLKEISSSIYLSTFQHSDTINTLNKINSAFAKVKEDLEDSISSSDWLDDLSKASMTSKLKKMKIVTNSATTVWKNLTFLDLRTETVFDNCDNYQNYTMALLKRNRKLLYEMWNEETLIPKNIWWYYNTPYNTNPVSIYQLNVIVAPLGMAINVPKDIPEFLYYIKVHYALAKAIGTHFDPIGLTYDINVNHESTSSYTNMETCVVDKFSRQMSHKFNHRYFDFLINGTISANKRIVEDMAVKLISDMAEDVIDNGPLLPWISGDYARSKLFFLALAQEHCRKINLEEFFIELFENNQLPPSLVIEYIFGNSNKFNSAFSCAEGSHMNPPVKCPAFPDIPKEYDYDYD